eukprot:365832-Chlamydomonas_euryale.AAC.14
MCPLPWPRQPRWRRRRRWRAWRQRQRQLAGGVRGQRCGRARSKCDRRRRRHCFREAGNRRCVRRRAGGPGVHTGRPPRRAFVVPWMSRHRRLQLTDKAFEQWLIEGAEAPELAGWPCSGCCSAGAVAAAAAVPATTASTGAAAAAPAAAVNRSGAARRARVCCLAAHLTLPARHDARRLAQRAGVAAVAARGMPGGAQQAQLPPRTHGWAACGARCRGSASERPLQQPTAAACGPSLAGAPVRQAAVRAARVWWRAAMPTAASLAAVPRLWHRHTVTAAAMAAAAVAAAAAAVAARSLWHRDAAPDAATAAAEASPPPCRKRRRPSRRLPAQLAPGCARRPPPPGPPRPRGWPLLFVTLRPVAA